ncbi:hypothetical protein Tco_0784057 [Tanacetum coccineum]
MVEMGFRVEQPLKRLQGFHSLQFLLLLEAKGLHLDPSWSELELQLSVSKLSSVIQGGAIYESLRANSNCACVAAIEVMVSFDLKGYSDSDYARCNMDRKSTSGACQLLGGKLVCWSAKKQQSVAMSSVEAEYVVVVGCCANILWMKSQLTNYDIIYEKPLDELTFKRLIVELGMLNIDSKPEASVPSEEN